MLCARRIEDFWKGIGDESGKYSYMVFENDAGGDRYLKARAGFIAYL